MCEVHKMPENVTMITANSNDIDIMAAIRQDPFIIDKVEKTPERCMLAVIKDGYTLRFIPKALHTSDLCLEAVKQNGLALKFVSKKVLTADICYEAVNNNGYALNYVPDNYLSENFYFRVVETNGLALKFVPKSTVSKELCIKAVEQNGLALEYVPNKNKSKNLCSIAVNKHALALAYVPDGLKTHLLISIAVDKDWRAFLHASEGAYTFDNCLAMLNRVMKAINNAAEKNFDGSIERLHEDSYFQRVIRPYIRGIIRRFPDDINNDIQFIRLERELRARAFAEKYYDTNKDRFFAIEHLYYLEGEPLVDKLEQAKGFNTFIEFYQHLDGDLKDANLYDYDFKGVNLNEFNIEGAYIRSDILISHNLYDDSFYNSNVKDIDSQTELLLSVENEIVDAISVLHEADIIPMSTLSDHSRKLYYISDIHLNHKILKSFPAYATRQEIVQYIKKMVRKMVATATEKSYDDFLLIAGDISFNFEISSIFYSELVEHWSHRRIIVVLGNHELWNYKQEGYAYNQLNPLEAIIQGYRELFNNLGIHFLQNDLFILHSNGMVDIIDEEKLQAIDSDVLRNFCMESTLTVLGGVGFSGLNPDFNAQKGIYRDTIATLDEDIVQTSRFESIYNKVNDALSKDRVIILTHTPKENWSTADYNNNWIYVNGHTHRNEYYCSDEKTAYSDNQIGYYSSSLGLKYFTSSGIYDVFRYYEDGIHIVTREQYLSFNRGMRIRSTYNKDGKIYMLKKLGIYCFIYPNPNGEKLYLLSGGKITTLEHNDINYYFDKMIYYSDAVKSVLKGYHNALKSVSNSIKAIGGTGEIHGCIVDVDFLNHIFFNPVDGEIFPYFATSMNNKIQYPNVGALLLAQREDLYKNYIKILNSMDEGVELLEGKASIVKSEAAQYISDTYMYSPSRTMRAIQYLVDANVIRLWNDKIMDIQSTNEEASNECLRKKDGTLLP